MFVIVLFSQVEGQAIVHKISFAQFTYIEGRPGPIYRHIDLARISPKRHKANTWGQCTVP